MLESTRLKLERAEYMTNIPAEAFAVRSDDPAALAKLQQHEKRMAQFAADIAKAEAEETRDSAADFNALPESRELRAIVDRASVARIVNHVAQGRGIQDGAERELQEHFGLDADAIPLRMLIPEQRAAASFGSDPATPGSSPGIAGQVFGDSVSAFMNVRFEDVPSGTRSYPVITTGALGNVGTPAKSAEQSETDAVLSVKELTPKRAQVQFAYTLEDAATFAGVDDGLSENIRAGLRDKIDSQILNRSGAGLITTGHSANPGTPGSATTAAQALAALASGVDGRHAGRMADVRMVVGTGTNGVFPYFAGLVYDTGSGLTVADKMGDALRVSPHIPAYGSNFQDALVIKGSQANTVAAVWPGVTVLRDPYTRESEGEIRLVGVMLHDFAILRTSGYIRNRFRTS